MDRISELPDFIVHKIMSHLSPKKVAQTSILSKRWNYLQTSFPILEFNQNHFMRKGVPFSDYRALLDGLLWSCCPWTLHVTATGEDEHKFLQWLYEELRNRCVNCCNSHNIKCWRHYLKDVKILSTLPMEDCRRKNRKLLNRDDDDLRDVWPINRHVIMCFDLDWVQ
ncbi:uncharacterized protein LOC116136088 [Pistacia vera]|uniref:uncharacterized protein LOC116136088 n=1 Tax=Pistacia vera TaxID=55513 RepID=UPI001263532C|nr:uncharacterized protein LOC116136088 [Pistacia vera]